MSRLLYQLSYTAVMNVYYIEKCMMCQAGAYLEARKSIFAIFIGFETEIIGKILKKRLFFSKNIIEMVKLQYHFSKTEFRCR